MKRRCYYSSYTQKRRANTIYTTGNKKEEGNPKVTATLNIRIYKTRTMPPKKTTVGPKLTSKSLVGLVNHTQAVEVR